jgi:hypothetical protein
MARGLRMSARMIVALSLPGHVTRRKHGDQFVGQRPVPGEGVPSAKRTVEYHSPRRGKALRT